MTRRKKMKMHPSTLSGAMGDDAIPYTALTCCRARAGAGRAVRSCKIRARSRQGGVTKMGGRAPSRIDLAEIVVAGPLEYYYPKKRHKRMPNSQKGGFLRKPLRRSRGYRRWRRSILHTAWNSEPLESVPLLCGAAGWSLCARLVLDRQCRSADAATDQTHAVWTNASCALLHAATVGDAAGRPAPAAICPPRTGGAIGVMIRDPD